MKLHYDYSDLLIAELEVTFKVQYPQLIVKYQVYIQWNLSDFIGSRKVYRKQRATPGFFEVKLG